MTRNLPSSNVADTLQKRTGSVSLRLDLIGEMSDARRQVLHVEGRVRLQAHREESGRVSDMQGRNLVALSTHRSKGRAVMSGAHPKDLAAGSEARLCAGRGILDDEACAEQE